MAGHGWLEGLARIDGLADWWDWHAAGLGMDAGRAHDVGSQVLGSSLGLCVRDLGVAMVMSSLCVATGG